jgi:hypothetical protein
MTSLHSHHRKNLKSNKESICLLEMETALHHLQDLFFTTHHLFAQYQEDLNHNRRIKCVNQMNTQYNHSIAKCKRYKR